MARPLRIQYSGAIYHLMSRGDRRQDIFRQPEDRLLFLETLAGAYGKTQWQVHAYCLMSDHFHFVVETPHPNLVAGMKWFLGTYTMRFNRRHHYSGHLFGGRYKAQVIDETAPGYLRTAADYVHLNPARAGLVAEDEKLASYPWSSYTAYLTPAGKRPAWLRVDRVLGEHGIEQDDRRGRREFERRLENQRQTQAGSGLGDDDAEWVARGRGGLSRSTVGEMGREDGRTSRRPEALGDRDREGAPFDCERVGARGLERRAAGKGTIRRCSEGGDCAAAAAGDDHAAQVDRRRTAYGHVDALKPPSARPKMSTSSGLTPISRDFDGTAAGFLRTQNIFAKSRTVGDRDFVTVKRQPENWVLGSFNWKR